MNTQFEEIDKLKCPHLDFCPVITTNIFVVSKIRGSKFRRENTKKNWRFHVSKRGFLINFLFQIFTVIFLQKRERMSPTVKFMVPFQTDIAATKMPPSVNKIIPAYQNADSYKQRRRNYLRMLQQTAKEIFNPSRMKLKSQTTTQIS